MAMFLRGKNVDLTYASSGKLREIPKKKGFAGSSGFEAIKSCLPKKDLTSDQLRIIRGIFDCSCMNDKPRQFDLKVV